MHCLTYAGPLQFHGEHRLLAACIIQPGLRANFSRESLQLSQWGKRWAAQLPQLALWIGPGGDAALFESRSPPWEGGLRGQGVRWNVPTSIPGPTLRRVPRECPLPIPTNPLPPPVRLPFPPQTHKWSMRFSQKQACYLLRCQLPNARGRLLTGQPPQQKQVYPKHFNLYAFTGNLRSCLISWFNAFCSQMDDEVEELCIGTMSRPRTLPWSSPGAIGWRAKQKANLATSP